MNGHEGMNSIFNCQGSSEYDGLDETNRNYRLEMIEKSHFSIQHLDGYYLACFFSLSVQT